MPDTRPTALLTGFEPFDGATRNPSWDAVELVARDWSGPARLETLRLPVSFAGSRARLAEAVARLRPEFVIAVGLAAGRAAITPERVGINLEDARIPDADGAQPVDERIEPDGPAARFATLPVKAIAAAIREAGIPSEVSNTAGTYVCNHVLYSLPGLDGLAPDARTGFLHVPATPDTGSGPGIPTLPLERIATGVRIALEISLTRREDLRESAGREH
ncbi:pyroglutamyl-peptidase I [Homoserinibacter sp. YIM 151385]|uniref:pyroglutamyl-peptidase I n=1 Tax=Homoserinibacter sp. YIM 151385 TaxID=2985506 RepID=UPI0022F06359|nr:pyroglutamyl-peptidase I [Homoserinibacter sp. YIM 151385]WBU38825.1 pyroglutamyl-peptidase I [Homoserinibacter sp. YIM 151385]